MSATRWLVALGSAGMLLAACGQGTPGGTVVGVRPPAGASVEAAPFDASSIAAEFAAQLAEISKLQSIGDNAAAYGLLPLDSTLTFRQSERLLTRQQQGDSEVVGRLSAISKVRSQVVADPSMSYYQKASLIGTLDGATATLNQMRVTIAREQLPDQIRPDIVKVNKLRIYTVVLPQARMMIAADLLVQIAATDAGRQASLQNMVTTKQACGRDVTAAQSYVSDLAAQITNMRSYSSAALAQVQGLSPDGYPGNKSSILSARSTLVAGQAAADRAAGDADLALAALARTPPCP
jgi:hypothetical protein